MNSNKNDSSSNEEVQSSGISSMSDDTPSLENGLSSQSSMSQYERWSEDSYNGISARYQSDVDNKQHSMRQDHPTAFREYSREPSQHFQHVRQNGLPNDNNNIGGPVHPAPNGNSAPIQTDLSPTMAGQNSLKMFGVSGDGFQPGSHIYQPFGDTGRTYFLDSDLETIEEESSVLESDFDDRSSIGYDRKRLPSDLRHSRSGSTSSVQSFSHRGSVTSTITVSDDDRSSSTLSSTPTSPNQRSSLSSRSDQSTPNNDQYERRSNSNLLNGTDGHRRVKKSGHGYEIGGIDPNAQQKIVYAKCLSPPEQPKKHHQHRSPAVKSLDYGKTLATMNGHHATTSSHKEQHEPRPQNHLSTRHQKSQNLTITDMFESVKKGDIQTLNKFSKTEQSETVDEKGNTILHAAAISGHLQCVKALAKGSCSQAVSLLNDDLMTPAALSVKHGHLCCVQWLVQNTEAKEELIVSSRQASIDGSNMRPPLAHVAARYNQDVVLDWLCEEMMKEKYPVDSADHHSNTAVHEAAAHGHLKCLQTLVGRGASVTVLNSHGDTPGQVADKNDHDLCVGYLVVVETCMSLAQQLITLKLENEGVKKENSNLRLQLQSMHNARIQQAKESVEERIKATLQNLTSYEEDNEVKPESPIVKTNNNTSVNQLHHEQQKISHVTEPSIFQHQDINKNVRIDTTTQKKENINNQKTINAQQTKTKSDDIIDSGTNSDQNPKNGIPNSAMSHKKAEYVSSPVKTQSAHRNAETNYQETEINGPVSSSFKPQVHNATQNGQADVGENAEVQSFMNGTSKANAVKPTPNLVGSSAVKAWEKMAMDEVIRMARDSRYLPSPTVSMCTEDSTMETREAMRDRLADASRWFLGQQSGGKPHIKDPLFPTHKMRPANTSQNLAKSPQKSMGNTASWVLGVQRSRKGHLQQSSGTPQQKRTVMPQNFVNATNQEFMRLQTEQTNALSKNQDQDSLHGSTHESFNKGSPIQSISSNSSSGFSEPRHHGRPNSAKSSCSTTSTIRSNIADSSSSTVSNSTTASQDTVVENGLGGSRWPHNDVADPLQKRYTPSSPGSTRSNKSSRPHSAKRIDVTPTLHNNINSRDGFPGYHSDMSSETAELRVTLPTRNNSFLRKVQPTSYVESAVFNTTPNTSIQSPISYPSIPSKQSPMTKIPSNMTSLVTSPTSPTKQSVATNIQQHQAEVSPQKVEIVSPRIPNGSTVPVPDKSNDPTSSAKGGYVMWRPSAKKTVKTVELGEDPRPVPDVEQSISDKNNKKTKQSKQPYGGLFSSNSPKTTSRRKMTKLFHF